MKNTFQVGETVLLKKWADKWLQDRDHQQGKEYFIVKLKENNLLQIEWEKSGFTVPFDWVKRLTKKQLGLVIE